MRRDLIAAVGFCALTALLATTAASAQSGQPGAQGRRAGPLDAGATVPADHPKLAGEADVGENPHGTEQGDPHGDGGGPRGGTASNGGMQPPPEDGALEDPSVPTGSVEVSIRDPAGKPLPRTEVTLGIVFNSVAKGESRKRVPGMTDDLGVVRFKDLDIGSGVAYRPMVLKDGATFSVTPFQLGLKSGIRAVLHVYPVVNDITQTLVVTQSMTYAEVKDDRIQIQQAIKVYNFGRNAWVPPNDLVVGLPENYTAFATQQGMTDVGVDAIPKKGLKLRGTFSPGQHVVEFKWQVPYSGDAEVKFDVGMPPHLAAARVIAPASKGMGMEVEGFDPTVTSTDGMGQRALVTEKQLRREDAPVKSIKIMIKGLPTEGPGKVIATLLAFSGLAIGLVLGSRKGLPRDTKREREQLLRALEGLELAHSEDRIGPKTYERARRELIDDIARTFAADPKSVKTATGATTKTTARKAP